MKYFLIYLIIICFSNPILASNRTNDRIKITKEKGYNVSQTKNFKVYSSLKRGETRKIIRYMELFAEKAINIYSINKTPSVLPAIWIFKTRKEFFIHTKQNQLTNSKYAGGYFHSQRNEIAVFLKNSFDSLIKTLFHELAHLYTYNYLKSLPQALNEGLSTYFESVSLKHHKLKFGLTSNSFFTTFKKIVKNHKLLTISPFIKIKGYKLGKIEETFGHNQYSQAWALTWYLLHGPDQIKNDFKTYIQTIRKKPDSEGNLFLQIVIKNEISFMKKWIKFMLNPNIHKKRYKTKNIQL